MAAHSLRCRVAAHLFSALAACLPFLLIGCGLGESGSQPAPIDKSQQQKVQQYLGGYREQLISEAKNQAKLKANAKATDAEKKAP